MMRGYFHFKLFLRDLTYSHSYGKYKYFIFYCIVIILTVAETLPLKELDGNSVDVFFLLLKDVGYFIQSSGYEIPVNWIFIQFFILFLITDFLVHDAETNSSYLILRIKRREQYILSKLIWIVIQNILVYFGLFIVIYVISSLLLGDFSLEASSYFQDTIQSQAAISINPIQLILHLFFGYVLTSIVLSGIFLLCTQFFASTVSFCFVLILGSLSIFIDWKWLPAIHSMILKSNLFDLEHHLSLTFSFVYSVFVYILSAFFTFIVYRKTDILK